MAAVLCPPLELNYTPEDCVLHGLQTRTCALEDAPSEICEEQLRAISTLQEIFGQWTKNVPTYPRQNKAPRTLPRNPPKKEKRKQKIQIGNRPPPQLPPSPAQVPRMQVMQTPPNSAPRVDIIPLPYITGISTYKPISHHTQASWTTPAAPIQRTHEPVAKRTRSQINPEELAHQVEISPRQAS